MEFSAELSGAKPSEKDMKVSTNSTAILLMPLLGPTGNGSDAEAWAPVRSPQVPTFLQTIAKRSLLSDEIGAF